MGTSTRTALRQGILKKIYSSHDIIISTAELLRIDSGTDVNESFAAADTTLSVDDGTKFTIGDYIVIDNEVLYVSGISTNDLTVQRAIGGTTDVAHADNSDVFFYVDFTTEHGITALSDSELAPSAQIEDYEGRWVYISTQPTATSSGALLDEALGATDTIIDIDVSGTDDAAPFAPGDGIQVEDEIMRVTAVNLTTEDLTVVRGIQGTTAATHAENTAVSIIGPAVGEITRVTNVDFSGKSSVLFVSPALSCRLVSGQEYEIHYELYPTKIHTKIDEILENIRAPIWVPLSLITDGDMEDDPTSNYTASNAILTEETTNVLFGRKSLNVTTTSANGYAYSGSVFVPPNTEVFCSTDCYVAAATVKFILYDVTNSEEIETAESGVDGWVHLEFVTTTPSDCERIRLHLVGQGAIDVIYFNNAVLLPTRRKLYDYPSALEWSEDLNGVFYYPRGTALSGDSEDKSFAVLENKAEKWSEISMIRDETAVTPYRIQIHKTPINRSLFVRGLVDYNTLTSDSSTTYAPSDIVIDLVYAELLDIWAQEDIDNGNEPAAITKEKRAEIIRARLSPRMHHFRPLVGKTRGTIYG